MSEAGKHYGEGIIKEYSKRLTMELNVKYSVRTLYKMMKHFRYMNNKKVPTVSAKLSWSHYDELLKFDDEIMINYYIKITEEQNLSVRQLREKIKSNEYERIDEKNKFKILDKEKQDVLDFVKNPILIKNIYNYDNISEKVLQNLILEDISSFMKELGKGYTSTRLKYFIRFYNVLLKSPTLSDELSWSHYCEIIWLDRDAIEYYVEMALTYNLSVRQLRERVKSREYELL